MKSEFINDKTHSKIGKEEKLDKVIGSLKISNESIVLNNMLNVFI